MANEPIHILQMESTYIYRLGDRDIPHHPLRHAGISVVRKSVEVVNRESFVMRIENGKLACHDNPFRFFCAFAAFFVSINAATFDDGFLDVISASQCHHTDPMEGVLPIL